MPEQENFIGVFPNALSDHACSEIIEKFESFPQVQTRGQIGGGVDESKKQSTDCCISDYKEWTETNQLLFNVTLQHLVQYVDRFPHLVCGALAPTIQLADGNVAEVSTEIWPTLPAEQKQQVVLHLYRPGYLNLQKYEQGTGGYHHWHSEIYPKESNCETLHRVLLFMFFLNTVNEGGETSFFYQDVKVKPQGGTMVIAPAGFTHTHKGNVPISSDKYIVTSWILFQRAEQIYGTQKP